MNYSFRKKLLIITTRFPYPPVGGDKVRLYNFIKILSENYSIDLVSLTDEKISDENISIVKKSCSNVLIFYLPKFQSYFNVLVGLINRNPLQVNYYKSHKLRLWIRKNIGNYEKVLCYHIRTTEYINQYINVKKYVDFVDAISMNCKNSISTSKFIRRFLCQIEYKRCFRYEKKIIQSFNKIAITSTVDKDFLNAGVLSSKIHIIGNYVPDIQFKEKNIPLIENSVCFFGKMDYKPNIDAVLFFIKKVFPSLRKIHKDVKFLIIGAKPSYEILRLKKIDGVSVTGYVDNPYELISSCTLVVAPMVSGSGIQNKILESMKIGKCVITSSLGAEGLDINNFKEAMIGDNPETLTKYIDLCLKDKLLREHIGSNAKKYIDTIFSQKSISQNIYNFIG